MLPGVKELIPSFDQTPISLGIFLPKVEGCDWEAAELPAMCRLPAVMDAGPYYGGRVDYDKFRPPIIEWLVPRGYAVLQMSIRGTGESGGCMELMSDNEQKDIDAMIGWIASQPWSNGNVGMMGRSYDGTTPLMAAGLANPALKTIVPISSVSSLRDLMFKNGTSEFRGPIFHNVVYWEAYGVAPGAAYRQDHLGEQACQEVVDGTTDPGLATLTGDSTAAYFEERDFQAKILENYRGSIWLVHGLEDWNVNPSMVVPWIRELKDAGIETKAWLGVWGHAYPDRVDEHRNVRWDWGQETLEWFDYYLKGQGAKPALDVEVEDSLFVWRSEATYPPTDAWLREWELGMDTLAEPGNATAGSFVLGGGALTAFTVGPLGGAGPAGDSFAVTSDPLAEDLRVAGLPQLHVEVTPTAAPSASGGPPWSSGTTRAAMAGRSPWPPDSRCWRRCSSSPWTRTSAPATACGSSSTRTGSRTCCPAPATSPWPSASERGRASSACPSWTGPRSCPPTRRRACRVPERPRWNEARPVAGPHSQWASRAIPG
jgi:hypothetical protein